MNIFSQLILQLSHVFDFMEMAFVSHALLALAILVIAKSYFDYIRQSCAKNMGVHSMLKKYLGNRRV